jgi:hypothetical protein
VRLNGSQSVGQKIDQGPLPARVSGQFVVVIARKSA